MFRRTYGVATYSRFLKILAREGEPRKFTYLCGDQGILVEQALDALKRVSGASSTNSDSLVATADSSAVWGAINQHALDSDDRRFVVVREAHKLTGWEQFESWLASRQAPNVRVVMLANERSWPLNRNLSARTKLMKSTQTLYVECSLPKSNPDKTAVEAIESWTSRLTSAQAQYLARRSGYDLSHCHDVCVWLEMLAGPVTTEILDMLTESTPSESFVQALVKMNKGEAATIAQRLSRAEQTTAISILGSALLDLDRVNRALKKAVLKSTDPQLIRMDTAKMADVKIDRVVELWDSAKHYDPQAVQRRAELLVLADENRGQLGVLERLAVEW